ncbi:MAG: hypothetical protein LBM95_08870 [Lactobacillales bacterium]|jgi:hypothetical protein|nr:hypothetical protein [Lactobacillales bacterium]
MRSKVKENIVLTLAFLLSLSVGMGLYYLKTQAHVLSEDGVAVSLALVPEKVTPDILVFLEKSSGERQILYQAEKLEKVEINELCFFQGTADLKVETSGKSYTIIRGIKGNRRNMLRAKARIYEKNGRFTVETRYSYVQEVNFSKFPKSEKLN